jgi:hypothetical protein
VSFSVLFVILSVCVNQCVFVIQCVVCHSECSVSFSVLCCLSFRALFVIIYMYVAYYSVFCLSFSVLFVIPCVVCHSVCFCHSVCCLSF